MNADARLRLLRLDRAAISHEIDPSGKLARQVDAVLADAFVAGGARAVLGTVGASECFDAPPEAEDYTEAWARAAYAMLVAAEKYVADRRLGADEFGRFLRRSWIGEAEPARANDLPGLLTGAVRCYCALYTGQLERDAVVAVVDSMALRLEAVVRKLARRAALEDEGVPLAVLVERDAIGLGAGLRRFARRTLFGERMLRVKILQATARAADYDALTLNALVLLLIKLAAAVS